MSNSPLVDYVLWSPNCSPHRIHKIEGVTIHCMAGDVSVENLGYYFSNPDTASSSNYGVDSEGRIGQYVKEESRSWATSDADNDHHMITIEVANDGGAETGWHVSDKALDSLVELLVDICKRNGIKELKWKADKTLIGNYKEQNMTVHRWFKNKACPGDYLYSKHYEIAERVNEELKDLTREETLALINEVLYGEGTMPSNWAYKEYNEAIKKGITDGKRPKGYATREEVALMVNRLSSQLEK